MKIGFFTHHPLSFNGGIESVSRGIVDALQKRGHEVHVRTVKEVHFSPTSRLIRKAAQKTPYSSLVDSWKLARATKDEQFDVVISNDFYGMFAKAPKKICFMHGYFGDVFHSIRHKISPLYYLWGMELARLQRVAISRADATVVPCNHSKNSFEEDGATISTVIPHGIDTNTFTPTQSKLKLPEHFLSHVASSAPWKNFEMVQELSKEHPIICVSKPKPLTHGQQIEFLQDLSINELAGLYSQSDAMIHPAYHEGFGLVACEAMACETPAVITNTGYGPDIAKEFPELVVMDPRNKSEFLNKLQYAIENKKKLGKKTRRFIQRNNDYSEWQKKWVDRVEE